MLRLAFVVALAALAAFNRAEAGFYSRSDAVVTLDPSNFDALVGANDSIWAVELYAQWCGHCKTLTPEWKQAAKALQGIVKVGAVDADTHRDIGQRFGVRGFPTIKVMYRKAGGSKLESADYTGGRTASAIVEGVLQQASKIALSRIGAASSGGSREAGGGGGAQGGCGAGGGGSAAGAEDLYGPDTDIVKLTDAVFHDEVSKSDDVWVVEFYAPWCGHCKRLAPEWESFARAVQGKVKVGAVDCTAHQATCQEFGVQGYPTIKVFGEDKERPSDYSGAREEGSLTAFALDLWRQTLPPPEVKQLVDQEGFVAQCVGSPADEELGLDTVEPRQLCFLLFVPHILDSQAVGRNKYLDVLKKLAEQHRTRPFSYLWAAGGEQPALEASVGVGGYGFPALVAINPNKNKYAALRGAFEYDSVRAFVDRVRSGTERVVPVQGDALPQVATTDSWDGSDGEAPEADEFSLDDLMSEEL